MKREYEISTTYEKREEIHRKYLNALDEVKNTGGEDINAIQDQLQKNKKRYDDLMLFNFSITSSSIAFSTDISSASI